MIKNHVIEKLSFYLIAVNEGNCLLKEKNKEYSALLYLYKILLLTLP